MEEKESVAICEVCGDEIQNPEEVRKVQGEIWCRDCLIRFRERLDLYYGD